MTSSHFHPASNTLYTRAPELSSSAKQGSVTASVRAIQTLCKQPSSESRSRVLYRQDAGRLLKRAGLNALHDRCLLVIESNSHMLCIYCCPCRQLHSRP